MKKAIRKNRCNYRDRDGRGWKHGIEMGSSQRDSRYLRLTNEIPRHADLMKHLNIIYTHVTRILSNSTRSVSLYKGMINCAMFSNMTLYRVCALGII